ncbi:MAG: envelope stress response membrane protein PspC [Dehalococcoidia bacterium]|nr:envelope stress response membrane protein PspC [Dehalococcoidia bacterium]
MTYNTLEKVRLPVFRSKSGWIFGVCAGFAQTFNLSLFWVRALLVLAFVFTGFFPMGLIYLLAALLMKVEPPREPKSMSEWEFYNSYASSKSLALARLKQRFERLDRRARRLEDLVTAREYDWDRRLREG